MANPATRTLLENNPQLNAVINNPDMMRQAMEAARNPTVMNEVR